MVIGFVRIGTVIIRIRRTNVGSRDDVVPKAVQEHGSPASGDTLPPRTTKFVPEHRPSMKEVRVVVLQVFACKFRCLKVA